jgi:hypothetical protein
MQMLHKSSSALYFKNTVPRVSSFFTVFATVNRIYVLICAHANVLKARHASPRDLDLKAKSHGLNRTWF